MIFTSSKLSTFIGEYLTQDQVDFISNCGLVDNTTKKKKKLQVISHCQNTKQTAATLLIDTEKVFDIIEIPCLKAVLTNIGRGSLFKKTIDTIYANPGAQLRINKMQFDTSPKRY